MAKDAKSVSRALVLDTTSAQYNVDLLNKKIDTYNTTLAKTTITEKQRIDTEKSLAAAIQKRGDIQAQIEQGLGATLQQQRRYIQDLTRDMDKLAVGTQAYANKRDELKKATEQMLQMKGAVKEVEAANTELGGSFGKILTRVAEFGAAYFTFDKIGEFIKGSIDEADQAEEAISNLANALQNVDRMDVFGKLTARADEFAEKYKALDNDDITKVFGRLVDYGKLSEEQMISLTDVIVNYARKQNVSLEEASDVMTKALEGNGKALKGYGINIKDGQTVTERFNLLTTDLAQKVQGAEAAFEKTRKGGIEQYKQGFRDLEENIGRFITGQGDLAEEMYKTALAAKNEGDEANKLVKEYEELQGKVNKTAAEKERMQSITTTLAHTFGNSVVEINKETGALQLNLEKTKLLIQQKLLLANPAAAELAGKWSVAIDNYSAAADDAAKNLAILNAKQKELGTTAEEANKKIMHVTAGPGMTSQADARSKEEKDLSDLAQAYTGSAYAVAKYAKEADELARKLNTLGISSKAIKDLLRPDNSPINDKAKPDDKPVDKDFENKVKQAQQELQKLKEDAAAEGLTGLSKDINAAVTLRVDKLKEWREKLSGGIISQKDFDEASASIEEKYQKAISVAIHKVNDAADERIAKNKVQLPIDVVPKIEPISAEEMKKVAESLGKISEELRQQMARDNIAKDKLSVLQAVNPEERKQALLKVLQDEYDAEIKNKVLTTEEKKLIDQQYADKRKAIEDDYLKANFNAAVQGAQALLGMFEGFEQARDSRENAALNKELKANDLRKQSLQKMLNSKQISQQAYDAAIAKMDADADKRKEAVEQEQFERNKRLQKAMLTIDYGRSIMAVWAQWPKWDGGIQMYIALAAATASYIGSMAKLNGAKFAEGGVLKGPSHAQGGIPLYGRNGAYYGEAEGGEVILSKKTVRNNWDYISPLLHTSMHGNGERLQPFWARPYQGIDNAAIARGARRYADGGFVQRDFSSQLDMGNQSSPATQELLNGNMMAMQQMMQTLDSLNRRLQQPVSVSLNKLQRAEDLQNRIYNDSAFK